MLDEYKAQQDDNIEKIVNSILKCSPTLKLITRFNFLLFL